MGSFKFESVFWRILGAKSMILLPIHVHPMSEVLFRWGNCLWVGLTVNSWRSRSLAKNKKSSPITIDIALTERHYLTKVRRLAVGP